MVSFQINQFLLLAVIPGTEDGSEGKTNDFIPFGKQ